MTALASTRRVSLELKVIGRKLDELMYVAALLRSEFACVGLVHCARPMARAASENAEMVIVLLDQACSAEEIRVAVEANRVLVAVVDACVENATELTAAGALVAPARRPALLEAIVASVAAQMVVTE